MAPDNKILTVAYGTFSCTLEGFDDPFSAMKDIAEYFRDLAAEDRFFGAEPPTPDVETLRNIAASRAQHAIEVHPDDDGVRLRRPAQKAAAPVADEDEIERFIKDARVSEAEDAAFPAAADEATDPLLDPAAGTQRAAAGEPRSTADKLAQIRDVVEQDDEPTAERTVFKRARIFDKRPPEPEVPAVSARVPEGDAAKHSRSDVPAAPAKGRVIRVRKVRRTEEPATPAPAVDEPAVEDREPAAHDREALTAETELPAQDGGDGNFGLTEATIADALRGNDAAEETSDDDGSMEHTDRDGYFANLAADTGEEDDLAEILGGDDESDDLMAELAAIRYDGETAAAPFEAASDAKGDEVSDGEMSSDEDETPEQRRSAAAPSDPDMERLFAATDSRLSDEDASRRHANISHLKAAVAARRADGPAATPETDETDAYRADLASTIRPRRPVTGDERTSRPERPTPLMLVSEQRVAKDAAEAADVHGASDQHGDRDGAFDNDGSATDGNDGFELFASEVGAVDLSDILEAAAVFSTKTLGQETFSRPHLLQLAAEACEDLTREEGLRGFGQLLREGTIRKISRGTFALSGGSRYTEEAERRAG
ncbi:hypothetical protein JSE7799_03032 [Jannaschia seosinensis]|uniref:Lipoprotein n=1 Tax=Jannaschia seosinensis TaxID=313367 RepID=A0A0M7BC35_9RHOB|nr:hypothetical protein [Jannaschia seosinensis]CUH40300.1 hypothetical protein JSE7799_03032 [Jannaschia seosinensis]